MQVGIIAPIKMLNRYCTTKVQYYLPGLLLSNEYRNFYSSLSKDTIKIMDCRKLGWKGGPESLDVCKEGLKLNPTYIILPSYMFSTEKTVGITKEYYTHLHYPIGKCIAHLEGTTRKEILNCAKELHVFSGYALFYYLYRICKKVPGGKLTFYIDHDLRYSELDELNGILVTSLPVRLGLQGRLLSNSYPSPPNLTFHEYEDRYPDVVEKNIEEEIKFYELSKLPFHRS